MTAIKAGRSLSLVDFESSTLSDDNKVICGVDSGKVKLLAVPKLDEDINSHTLMITR